MVSQDPKYETKKRWRLLNREKHKEASKCVLLCVRCHREFHGGVICL